MLKMISIGGGVIVVVIAAVLVYAATKPDTFRVERATSIKATPEAIFALINDFHNFPDWSPYEKLDPDMKRSYSGAVDGKGAVYVWDSNGKAGTGRMEIADTAPPSKVTINLDFSKPFVAHNIVEFTLEPRGESTLVTWAMQGPVPYVAQIMHVIFNMDRMIGGDFETGLANLKRLTER
jgi:carbon monoxide dehydrogenase subunit G